MVVELSGASLLWFKCGDGFKMGRFLHFNSSAPEQRRHFLGRKILKHVALYCFLSLLRLQSVVVVVIEAVRWL